MKTTKNLLSVVMDGIRDTDMLLDYAEEAEWENQSECAAFFRAHAKKRLDALNDMRNKAYDRIGITAKIDAGDEIACALKEHIDEQVKELEYRIS